MGDWMIVPSDSDLLHHGRLGQKWGQRNGPPYPLGMSERTYKVVQKTGKAVATVVKGTGKAAAATAKALKKHHDETKAKNQVKKAEKEKKKTEKMKKRAISNNSYQELYDMKDRLTYNELKDAKERIRLEQEIYSLGNPPPPRLRDKINSVMKTVGMVNDWYKTGTSAWNNFAEITGAPKIGQKNKQNNNNNNKENQKQNKESKGGTSNTYVFGEGSQSVFIDNYNGKNNKNNNQNQGQGKPDKERKGKGKGKGKNSK